MEENVDSTTRLSREEMKLLLRRRDAPGLALFTAQITAFALLGALTPHLAAAGSSLTPVSVVMTGLVLLTFFASMHEAGHGTAFATPWLNSLVLGISAPLMLQAPTFFREFHFEHHRRTSDPHGDPEISGAPGLLGPWPRSPFLYLAQAAGQHLMVGKALFTIGPALLPGDVFFERFFPFIRKEKRRRVVLESRVVVLVLGAVIWLGWHQVEGFPALLLAWPVAHFALSLFVMPEHTGLDTSGTQIHRTRSTRSNALVRLAMWNMPYHAEHHAFPAVPFHAAPELSRRIDADLENRASGYLAFHLEGLAHSLRGGAPA